jgi:hypothetical protein
MRDQMHFMLAFKHESNLKFYFLQKQIEKMCCVSAIELPMNMNKPK